MKRSLNLKMLLLVLWFIFSCENRHEEIKYHSNGEVSSIIETRNGIKDGKATWYDSVGNKISMGTYAAGLLQGPYYEYYPSGKVKLEANYQSNLKSGILIEYFEDGYLKSKQTFFNDSLSGYLVFFHSNGKVKMKAYAQRDNPLCFIEYDEKGKEIERKDYILLEKIEQRKKIYCYKLIYFSADTSFINDRSIVVELGEKEIFPSTTRIDGNAVKLCFEDERRDLQKATVFFPTSNGFLHSVNF